MSAHMTHLSF
uniref:Uncharacterized protein n=1 Tax=Anguilla anguilla TaxID=7936 RepID=A0A0E9VT12_ANGAN